MKKTLAVLVAVASFAAVAIVSQTAVAQPKAAASASGGKAEFAAGRAKFNAKDFAAALPLFRAAFEASGSPNASLYLGLCLVELNQPVEAYEVLSTTARESERKVASDAGYQHTADVAKGKLAELEKKVARVEVTLVGAPSGVAVTLNDKPVASERLGAPIAIPAGKVVVVASAPGRPEQRVEVTVAAGETKPAALRFVGPAQGGSLGPAIVAGPGTNAGRPLSTMRVAGLAVAGVGVVGFGVMIGAGASSNGKYDDVKTHCPAPCTNPKYIAEISSGKTLDALANVGLAVGIVGVVGGGVLFVLGGRKSESGAALEIGPGRVDLAGTF